MPRGCQETHHAKRLPRDAPCQEAAKRPTMPRGCQETHHAKRLPRDALCQEAAKRRTMPRGCQETHYAKRLPRDPLCHCQETHHAKRLPRDALCQEAAKRRTMPRGCHVSPPPEGCGLIMALITWTHHSSLMTRSATPAPPCWPSFIPVTMVTAPSPALMEMQPGVWPVVGRRGGGCTLSEDPGDNQMFWRSSRRKRTGGFYLQCSPPVNPSMKWARSECLTHLEQGGRWASLGQVLFPWEPGLRCKHTQDNNTWSLGDGYTCRQN